MKRYMISGILANTIFGILGSALANAVLFGKAGKIKLFSDLLALISRDMTTGITIGILYCFVVYAINRIILFYIEEKFLYIVLNGMIFYCWVSFISIAFFT